MTGTKTAVLSLVSLDKLVSGIILSKDKILFSIVVVARQGHLHPVCGAPTVIIKLYSKCTDVYSKEDRKHIYFRDSDPQPRHFLLPHNSLGLPGQTNWCGTSLLRLEADSQPRRTIDPIWACFKRHTVKEGCHCCSQIKPPVRVSSRC